jgi:hypothetical protein
LSGTVSYKGKKLMYGQVSVVGSDGVPKGGVIEKDGTYAVKDIATGAVKIGVYSPDPATILPPKRKPKDNPKPPDNTGWFAIPDKYADAEKSGLKLDLHSGSNSKDINLD